MAEISLGLLVLRTSQLEKVLAFYTALGLVVVEERHGSGPLHYSCQFGTTVLEIYPGSPQPSPDPRKSGSTLLGFNVAFLDRILEAMQKLEAPIQTAPKTTAWGRRAVVLDPDGRAIELNEPPSHG